jgi:hypothetical protein
MSDVNEIPEKVVQLTNDILNGRIDSDGIRSLEDLLRGNETAQKFFRSFCQLHVDLHAETQAQRIIQLFASDDWKCDRPTLAIGPPVDVAMRLATNGDQKNARRRVYGYVLVTAISAVIIIVALTAMRSNRTAHEVAVNHEPALATEDVISINIVSDESRRLPIKDVGTIFIQGPAELELIGSSRAKLTKGRVRVRITNPKGRGFVLETPRGQVTDLGTEFGVGVAKDSDTDVVVFEGKIDLAYKNELLAPQNALQVQQLVQGEGLSIGQSGNVHRIISIVRGDLATFRTQKEYGADDRQIIVDVSDNIREADVRSFYEIVPRGLKEDALAYVDRPAHDWNGVDKRGMPPYLVGADYVKPFNCDKARKDIEITVTLAKPARLFVFFDDRVPTPEWLRKDFRNTGDKMGHDTGPFVLKGVHYNGAKRGKGPGVSIDAKCSVWEQIVKRPGTVRLGPNSGAPVWSTMYGIAAVPLDSDKRAELKKSLSNAR